MMRLPTFLKYAAILTLSLVITLALRPIAHAQTESTLHTFSPTTSFWPQGALIEDSAGNLYGTTRGGGTYGVGTIFKMSPPAVSGGVWPLTTLYNFVPYGSGGYVPISDLITDSTGAFYGTTFSGGDPVCNCGGVYKLIPPVQAGGAWTEQSLYAFTGNDIDGRLPATAPLTMAPQGILYGVTIRGGTWDSGVIYQLTPATDGTYTESVLYSFGDLADASTPNGPITLDSSGALYGVTSLGGVFNNGTVYKFVPAGNGQLAIESILFSFKAGTKSGVTPIGNLLFDSAGNLYGVTNAGGSANDDGTVFKLTPAKAAWTESTLYVFNKKSGANPEGGLTWNPATGALYGTTSAQNGKTTGDGSVFKLLPPTVQGGAWTESTLYQFTYATVGGYPTGSVTRDPTTGTLYGTAINGGITGCDLFCGTVWQIVNP
jgi:uncharacterized repeat protein (TIGR03803 family)